MTIITDKDGSRIVLEQITNYFKVTSDGKEYCRVVFVNNNSVVFNLTCEDLDYAFERVGKVFWISDDKN